jgi:hypothetical protein
VKRTIVVEKLSGDDILGAALYSYKFVGEKKTAFELYFDKFELEPSVEWDFDVIEQRLNKIEEYGAEDEHFRLEGKAVKALPIETSILRLYCYRVDVGILILGNGGLKPVNPVKEKNKLKDFPELQKYADIVRAVGDEIKRQLNNNEIGRFRNDLQDLEPFEIEIPND